MLPGDKIFGKRSNPLNGLGQLGNINFGNITINRLQRTVFAPVRTVRPVRPVRRF